MRSENKKLTDQNMQLEGEVAELRRELANFRLTEIDAAGEEADQLEQLGAEAVRKRLGRICSAKAGGSHGCCLTIFGIYIGKIWENPGFKLQRLYHFASHIS